MFIIRHKLRKKVPKIQPTPRTRRSTGRSGVSRINDLGNGLGIGLGIDYTNGEASTSNPDNGSWLDTPEWSHKCLNTPEEKNENMKGMEVKEKHGSNKGGMQKDMQKDEGQEK